VNSGLDRALSLARFDPDPAHRPAAAWQLVVATVVAVGASLGADALLVAAGAALFPTTTHYVHFQFHDYARLTVIGVLIACVGWPVVVRLSSAPRWLFARLAVAVTLVLWLPDLYLLHLGQPTKAVGVLMVMHLAIAVVTYNALVRIAPPRRSASAGTEVPGRA
jgi:hypothetical protein